MLDDKHAHSAIKALRRKVDLMTALAAASTVLLCLFAPCAAAVDIAAAFTNGDPCVLRLKKAMAAEIKAPVQATPIYVEPTVEAVRACWSARVPWQVTFCRHAINEGRLQCCQDSF